ncbi:MAG: tRNA dihydrouridine(20/20a) synthase DusA [Sandaracinaceae bacterium]
MPRATEMPLSVAPMMDRTDRHYRFFVRQITRRTLLYTEMVTTGALVHGDRAHHLDYDEEEHPIALQLGGDDPEALAECAKMGEDWGYDEININVGCPSDRVQRGCFGVSLMGRPERVAECVAAMRRRVDVPVTVKHRIGFDDIDRYEDMLRFVDIVAEAESDRFTVHARKAWLEGLSPKQNRNVPPLRYDEVHRLKRERPHLFVEINGGIKTLDQVAEQLEHVDAVMLGRAAYDDPYLFADADRRFFDDDRDVPSRHEVIERMVDYADRWVKDGGRLHHATRHLMNLFSGMPGARAFRRHLAENATRKGAGADVLREALAKVPTEARKRAG